MNHLIMGAGVVGYATGIWLKANNQDVTFLDIDEKVRTKLKNKNLNVISNLDNVHTNVYDIIWICTAEWNAEEALTSLVDLTDPIIVIRSTTAPGTVKAWAEKYQVHKLFHIPEFLKEATAIEDIFNPDRVVIGETNRYASITLYTVMQDFYPNVPVIITDSTTSETIKLVSNCWLSTQISYWNDIHSLCSKLNINPQQVAEACCLDKRISKYGTKMIGQKFGGFCLPKDLTTLCKTFDQVGIKNNLLNSVMETNICKK